VAVNRVPRGTFVRRVRAFNWMAGHITGHVETPEDQRLGVVRYLIQWEVSKPSELHARDEFRVIKDQDAARERWMAR